MSKKVSLLSFFQHSLNDLSSLKACVYTKHKSGNENALGTTKKISYVIEHEGEAHTDGEKLVKLCAFIWLHA